MEAQLENLYDWYKISEIEDGMFEWFLLQHGGPCFWSVNPQESQKVADKMERIQDFKARKG